MIVTAYDHGFIVRQTCLLQCLSITGDPFGTGRDARRSGNAGDVLMTEGQKILRTKGILNMDRSDKRYVFQAVHMVSEGNFTGPWPAKDKRKSRIVFIGRNLDEAKLREGFARCAVF